MQFSRITRASVLAGALMLACAAPSQDGQGHGNEGVRGVLVIAGGAVDDRSEVLPRFVAEARDAAVRREQAEAIIEVLPTASADPAGSLAHNRGLFASIATEVTVQGIELGQDDAELASDPETVARLSRASGIWFTGGNQSRITSVFRPTREAGLPLYRTAREMLATGGVIGGSSAGAAMMSETMLAGGSSEGALLHGDGEGGVKLTHGMGFFPHGIVDQHFLARGRTGRLLVALELTDERFGFGIEENSALVVYLGDHDHAVAVGARGVCILDLGAGVRDAHPGAHEFELTLLGTDDAWDFESGRASPRAGRVALTASAIGKTQTDPNAAPLVLWESGSIDRALLRLSRRPTEPQVLSSEHFRLELTRGPETVLLVAPGNASDLFATRVQCHLARRD